MGRAICFVLFLVPMIASAAECVGFSRLAPDFASELSLDVKRANIRFVPVNLALESAKKESPAYVLADQESCSVRGDCDSVVYLGDEKGCYRSVLSFRGKWKGVDPKKGRELASLVIESRFEGDGVMGEAPIRIERRSRRFEYDPSTTRYGEAK